MNKLLSVSHALEQILTDVAPTQIEHVDLAQAGGRILAQDIAALRTQPPFAASAMDGYAVRQQDLFKDANTPLQLIGESAAGHGFKGTVAAQQCVRIFTGAPLPTGADTIIIQENVAAQGSQITVLKNEKAGRYIRPAGLDFHQGDVLLKAGTKLTASPLSLAASMNHARLPVQSKPRVAIIATGDELLAPGSALQADQIIASNSFGLAQIVTQAGATPIDLGIAADTFDSLNEKLAQTKDVDLVVTLGGASVGDHDLVHQALEQHGVALNFWKLAMRPGKPVMFGIAHEGDKTTRYIGLPGNPVSSLVCALVFVVPLIKKMLATLDCSTPQANRQKARLTCALQENDQREEYMRGTYTHIDGHYHVTPFDSQDSSILSLMAKANCLIVRPAHAPQAAKGDACDIMLLD